MIKTDIAIESFEEQNKTEIEGVRVTEKRGMSVVEVLNNKGSKSIGKPVGKYITVEIPTIVNDTDFFDGRIEKIAKIISKLLPKERDCSVLVAGIGNLQITADALGPKVNNFVIATRHITNEMKKILKLEMLNNVATITTGVLGQTGIESAEIIKGVSNVIKPDCVIVVDALASSSVSRLGTTIQLSDVGISPGSGVGNHRFEISKRVLGVPVISIGIPTVVGTSVIAKEYGNVENFETKNQLFVTPREIDSLIEHGAKLIGMGINCAIQKDIDLKDLFALVG